MTLLAQIDQYRLDAARFNEQLLANATPDNAAKIAGTTQGNNLAAIWNASRAIAEHVDAIESNPGGNK